MAAKLVIDVTQVPIDYRLLIGCQRLAGEPCASQSAKQVGMGRGRDDVCIQDRIHFVLDPGMTPHDLATAGGLAPPRWS